MQKQFLLALLVAVCTCSRLPPSFKKCDRKRSDFNQCLLTAFEGAIRQLKAPIKELGLPKLEPLEIPAMEIEPGNVVGFRQIYKDIKIGGLTKIKCSKVEMNFETKTFVAACSVPYVNMVYNYEFNGRILLLSFNGKGPGSSTLVRPNTTLTFNFEEYEKGSKKYFKVVDCKFVMEPEGLVSKFDNLLGSDKEVNQNLNEVINDNWKELFDDVGGSYAEGFAKLFTVVFNNLLSKVPISQIFGDE